MGVKVLWLRCVRTLPRERERYSLPDVCKQGKSTPPSISAGARPIQSSSPSKSSPSSAPDHYVAILLTNLSGMTLRGTTGSSFCLPLNFMEGKALYLDPYSSKMHVTDARVDG